MSNCGFQLCTHTLVTVMFLYQFVSFGDTSTFLYGIYHLCKTTKMIYFWRSENIQEILVEKKTFKIMED
jgi:hypothetical protein